MGALVCFPWGEGQGRGQTVACGHEPRINIKTEAPSQAKKSLWSGDVGPCKGAVTGDRVDPALG